MGNAVSLSLPGLALVILAWGTSIWLSRIGDARKIEAKARLLEAENRRAALTDRGQGEGSDDAS